VAGEGRGGRTGKGQDGREKGKGKEREGAEGDSVPHFFFYF